MNRVQLPLVAALLAAAAISLVGCGGGGGGTTDQPSANNTTNPPAGTTNQPNGNIVTVSPSLGKFSAGAHVSIKNTSGTSVGTADTTAAGTANVNVGSHTGPMVIEVTGDTNVTYYDEGSKDPVAKFGTGQVLRAIAPSVTATVGVTAATNASVESIKSNNGGAIPVAITANTIETANNKIAVALGISDVLQAPKLVDANTGTTLDLATAADKYALQLAALAKLASTGKTALDVAVDIAKDLQDGILDGKSNGSAISGRSTSYTEASVADDLSKNVISAANDLGNSNTKKVVTSDPTVVGVVTTNVTNVVATSPAVTLAKNLFSELRTTLSSFANQAKTGFLNDQASRIDADLKLVVTPEAAKVSARVSTISLALQTYEDAQLPDPSTKGMTSGTISLPGYTSITSAWINQRGSLNDVVAGVGGSEYCFIDRSLLSGPVTCFAANSTSIDRTTNPPTIKLIKYVLTPSSGANQFTYVADRENRSITLANQSPVGSVTQIALTIPGGAGTITRNGTTSFTLSGTLPPSAASAPGTLATGVDTIALSATKTLLTGSNYRYAISGNVSTTSTATPPQLVSFSFDNGSYFDVDETNAATTGTQMVAFNLSGTAKTDATKLTGSLSMSGFIKDKSGTSTIASSVVFNGVLSDTSVGGAGDILTGKLEATVSNYSAYDVTQLTSSSNYIQGTAAFTGTIQAPSRPLMKLVISGNATGANAGSATVSYSYGSVIITATGSSSPSGSTSTISNQDGIQIAADPNVAKQQLITKDGVTLAKVLNGVINYVDGSSETMN